MKNTYQTVFNELQKTIPNGRIIQDVMDVLVKQGLVTGGLEKPIQWLFNFSGGGWNSVIAKTLKEANEKIRAEYGNSVTLVPDYRSIRPSTEKEYKSLLRNSD